jgi:catalase
MTVGALERRNQYGPTKDEFWSTVMNHNIATRTLNEFSQETLLIIKNNIQRLEDYSAQPSNDHEPIALDQCESAYGFFQVYESMAHYTKAGFLQDSQLKTPVFVNFTNHRLDAADTVRSVRGFAVKFYSEEGNYDLVGHNIPVLASHDALKVADFIRASHQASSEATSAADNFWSFVSSTPETMHMLMWMMSDRATPRSLRMMEGFGVHTCRFVNAQGIACFVKFHWKPLLGAHSFVWEEAKKLTDKDASFYHRDLWEAIAIGDYPEWELGVQIIPEDDQFKFEFDLLDATKLIPEEIVPVVRIGKMTLNCNPRRAFADRDNGVFHPRHLVPGIEFCNDSLLQNSSRVRSLAALIGTEQTQAPAEAVGRLHHHSAASADHFSQALLFWRSQSVPEQDHIVDAFQLELAKVTLPDVRARMISLLSEVDINLASRVAKALNIVVTPKPAKKMWKKLLASPALSMANSAKNSIKTRKVAILVANGVDRQSIIDMKATLEKAGAHAFILAEHLGSVLTTDHEEILIDYSIASMPSVMFDAVFIPDGEQNIASLLRCSKAILFLLESYKHGKSIAVMTDGQKILTGLSIACDEDAITSLPEGVIAARKNSKLADIAKDFIAAIAQHRHWTRCRSRSSIIKYPFSFNLPNLTPLIHC